MKWGLLSTARINNKIIAAAAQSDRATVVAVASRDKSRAEEYARRTQIPRAYGSYEALLDDPEVDAVYISLPNAMHHDWSLRALAAGKHVLCEKPYSRHPKEVEEAFAAADVAGRVLMEAFMYRHHPQTKRIAQLVQDGAVGRVIAIKAVFTFGPAGRTERAPRTRSRRRIAHGRGLLLRQRRAPPRGRAPARSRRASRRTGVDAGLYGTMRHQGDVVSQFESSFVAPRRQRLEVVGEDAMLVAEAPWVDWGGQLMIVRAGKAETIEVPAANSYQLELENMADAAAGRAPALLGRADALGQSRTIAALYRSASDRRAVDLTKS